MGALEAKPELAASSVQTIRISKTINAPMKFVFNWCTDFTEDDPKFTGSSSRRIILEKSKKRAVYASIYKAEDGKEKIGVNVVTLKSPTAWHLEYYGEEDNEVGEYKLSNLGKGKTKLNMVFKEMWKTPKFPTVEEQVRDSGRHWDQYIAALESEYSAQKK